MARGYGNYSFACLLPYGTSSQPEGWSWGSWGGSAIALFRARSAIAPLTFLTLR